METPKRKRKYPIWFLLLNIASLLPILLWPMVLFGSIFMFDNPTNMAATITLFLAVVGYPVYLIASMIISLRLYNRKRTVAIILPVVFIALFSFLICMAVFA